jgi:hypothetical protein
VGKARFSSGKLRGMLVYLNNNRKEISTWALTKFAMQHA